MYYCFARQVVWDRLLVAAIYEDGSLCVRAFMDVREGYSRQSMDMLSSYLVREIEREIRLGRCNPPLGTAPIPPLPVVDNEEHKIDNIWRI